MHVPTGETGQPSPTRPTTELVPGGLRQKSIAPQRLVGDWTLAGCETMEWEGEQRPCMGGIPLLAKLGKGGMEGILEVPLSDDEAAALNNSASAVRKTMDELANLDF